LCGAETGTRRKLDQNYLERFETWNREGWRRSVGPIMWKEARLQRVREERNILHTIKRRKG